MSTVALKIHVEFDYFKKWNCNALSSEQAIKLESDVICFFRQPGQNVEVLDSKTASGNR